jgi:hypothetical protein
MDFNAPKGHTDDQKTTKSKVSKIVLYLMKMNHY